MMFSPSTIHVLPFDPHHGNDNARVYAGKYASKPEKARIMSAFAPVVLRLCNTLISCWALLATYQKYAPPVVITWAQWDELTSWHSHSEKID